MKNNSVKVLKSACRMCHGGCGCLVYVENGKITRIKGDPASPLNRGKMCVKGQASIEHLYNPARLKYPLKRVGKRGEGKWERISWDDALGEIVKNINEVKEKYGIESLVIGQGTGRHHFFSRKTCPWLWVWESNANVLTDDGPPYDPAVGSKNRKQRTCE